MDYEFLESLKKHTAQPYKAYKNEILDNRGYIVLVISGRYGIGWRELPSVAQWIADKLNEEQADDAEDEP